MNRLALWVVVSSCATPTFAEGPRVDVDPLIESSCIHCHDSETETRLNFESLDHDLANPETFRKRVRIFDRLQKGEMPPESETRPDEEQLAKALTSLNKSLREANLSAQEKNGRVPLRRLTRREYEYTLHDLLDIRGELARLLPPENESFGFDTESMVRKHHLDRFFLQHSLAFILSTIDKHLAEPGVVLDR